MGGRAPKPAYGDGLRGRGRFANVYASRSARESENQRERLRRPWPQFTDEVLAAGADEAAEDECDDDRVVELTGNGDEVRDDVERERQVTDEWKQ
jgi:hypothetical protein